MWLLLSVTLVPVCPPLCANRNGSRIDSVQLNSSFSVLENRDADCRLSNCAGVSERASCFWDRCLPGLRDAISEKELHSPGRRKVAAGARTSANEQKQKPPIFVLKNPERIPIIEGGNSGPKFVSDESGYVALIGRPSEGKSTLLNQIIGQKLSINWVYLFQMVEVLEEGMSASYEGRPTLFVLNKIDLIKPGEIAKKTEWYQSFGGMDDVIAASAKQGRGVDIVKKWLIDRLPKGPAYYPKDIVSEHPERFFVAEIIREYRQEVPYVSEMNVLNYTEEVLRKRFH